MSSYPLVLVIGATGHTGAPIVDALLQSGDFRVAALVRPSSVSKPEITALRERGVDIRVANIQTDSIEKLKDAVAGVDTLISTVYAGLLAHQKGIFTAAKHTGVKRIIPCDFGTPGGRGVLDLRDEKLDIRDFVRSLGGVGYTFIDVGWWMQNAFPFPTTYDDRLKLVALSREFYGDGNKKNLYVNCKHIGKWVARIIKDERTLNQYVIVWEDERTLEEAKTIGERASGEEEALRAKRVPVSGDELLRRAAAGKEEASRSKSFSALLDWLRSQYQYSMHLIGENSLENAKAVGALDAQELFPDVDAQTLEEFAQEFYANPPPVYL